MARRRPLLFRAVRRMPDRKSGAFFEWRKGSAGQKQPYAIARADGQPMALAGLWDGWRGPDGEIERTFAIVTVAASPDVAELHNRMPLIIEPADWPLWLGETEGEPAALLRPSPAGKLRLWPVSSRVNDPKNNEPALLEPVAGNAASGENLTLGARAGRRR